MMKFSVEQWDKNKHRLEKDIRENFSYYNVANYVDLVAKVVDLIFNDEDDILYDSENITEVDNGDCQGTLLYLIPEKSYQPSEYEYLMTYVGYGSCSGCDTLLSIQMWNFDETDEERKEEFVKDMMGLCLHLVQNTIKPYNIGWRKDEKYNIVE